MFVFVTFLGTLSTCMRFGETACRSHTNIIFKKYTCCPNKLVSYVITHLLLMQVLVCGTGNDNLKISFTMASSITVLAWGAYEWSETYSNHGLINRMKEMLKWPLDYLMKTFNKDTEMIFTMVELIKYKQVKHTKVEIYTNRRRSYFRRLAVSLL